ncbi:MAG TPA: 30S ribosomal protein S18 [Atribacterota bacterium]|nr:30S ribosomal protein S18 [Atribacterota bacterium]HOR41763.1 30S ribosomal protein S18 [Atribacterota bacterium]HPK86869.1 30S ribosomal protein S18 [Atribacterota bacterium]
MIRRSNYRGLRVRRKICYFCAEKKEANYKDVELLNRFISDQGKILPRRITGSCAKHQRSLAAAIKRAREAALLPFVSQ